MKTIIFDFDGTLTKKHQNVWKYLWKKTPYGIEMNNLFYTLFSKGKITYQKWAELDFYYLKKGGIDVFSLKEAAENVVLQDGCFEFLKALKTNSYDLHIVSGGIKCVIKQCLKPHAQLFTNISANNFSFNEDGSLKDIIVTPYDNEGKALYIEELMAKNNLSPNDILFIGNSTNDEFVHKTGCHTLCINAETKNVSNKTIWNNSIETDNLTNLIPVIENIFSETKEK